MDNNRVWAYHILGQSSGIVLADDKTEAREKVVKAYSDHGDSLSDCEIQITECGWFSDNPDVLKLLEIIRRQGNSDLMAGLEETI